MKAILGITSSIVIGLASQAFGALVDSASVEAFNNATVQPGGPRAGSSGKAFFNVEGSNNGNFASYGIARWDLSSVKSQFDTTFGAGSWSISAVSLEMTQSNAGFTTNGGVEIFFTGDDATDTEPGTSPLTYPLSGDFADLTSAATYTFTQVANGTVDSETIYDSNIANTAGGVALVADILSNDTVTLVISEIDATTAATYAGFSNSTFAGPTLVITAVPEPATIALVLLTGVGALRRRRLP